MSSQTLGYCDGSLWIRFQDGVAKLPAIIKLTKCAKQYLLNNDWTYLEGSDCGDADGNVLALRLINTICGIDLKGVCNLHDLEYSLNVLADDTHTCVKSSAHKTMADVTLLWNIIIHTREYGKRPNLGLMMGVIYFVGVAVFGGKSYWGSIPKNLRT